MLWAASFVCPLATVFLVRFWRQDTIVYRAKTVAFVLGTVAMLVVTVVDTLADWSG